jgi:type II secretory pathway predicted ATPase ExeA
MLMDVMDFFGLTKDFDNAGFFETDHHQQIVKEVKGAVKLGKLVALTGIVGSGKTTLLHQIKSELEREKEVIVAQSLAIDKNRVSLPILITALFYDLTTEKEVFIPTQPEKRERKLQELACKKQKPVALFVDEAHDLHPKTLKGLKRLMEMVKDGGGSLSLVLIGHPKLKNDLRRSSMEEIGARATVLTLEGIKGSRKEYLDWLLGRCASGRTKPQDIICSDALDLIADRLTTPLQINQYLAMAVEEAYKSGVKPITVEVVESVLAKDLDGMEARLARNGYQAKAIAEILNVRPAVIKSLFNGQLEPVKAQELKSELLAAGVPI